MSIIQGIGSDEVSTGFYPHSINQSLRFNDDDDTHLDRTMVSATDNKKYTMAFWVKRCSLGLFQFIFTAGTSPNGYFSFNNDDTIKIRNAAGSHDFVTTQKFRDIGSWYHFTYSFDSANSIAKLYVNGTQVTDFSTQVQPGANEASVINSAVAHVIGNFSANGLYDIDMYLAEFYFVDGHALTPSTFGETKNDIWVAKNASPTIKALTNGFGNNGFHLTFSDSSDIGADSSGEGHNFTPDSFQPDNVVSDSPTKNFATLGAQPIVNHTLSEGGLKTTNSSTNNGGTTATFNYPTAGKWYHEVTILAETDDRGQGVGIGNQRARSQTQWGNYLNLIGYLSSGEKLVDTGYASYGTAHAVGNIIGVAYNADDQELEFYLANAAGQTASSQGTITTAQMDGVVDFANLTPLAFGRQVTQTFNFGQSAFNGTDGSGTLPTGFEALNTANLADPGIDPAAGETPDEYFDTILYQAATSNGTYTRGSIAFTPDWSWIKNRNDSERHLWADVIRGNTSMTDKWLVSDDSAVEGANGVSGTTFSVTSSGYQFVESSIDTGELFFNNRLYVGWNWKAGTSQSFSGESGTLDSTVSSSSEAGFSIVKYTGGSDERVKHGMGTNNIPEMILVKSTSDASNWAVYHIGLSANHFIELNSTGAQQSGSNPRFQGTGGASVPTDTYFFVNNYSGSTTNNSNSIYIAYCFRSVDGYSKISKYKGNGSADGTFVFTGFRPAWLMIKRFDSGSESWNIVDNKRNPFNGAKTLLRADVTNQESDATNGIDLLSNGFKVRDNIGNYNTGDADYLYMAFADQPFRYSNAR